MTELVDYESDITENLRWADFEFRPGDVVIAAPAKSGTTWTQQLVGSLIFLGKEMPGSIAELSPWLDMRIRSKEHVFAALDGQEHRRFIKTHTPLDGVQWSDDVAYVCVGRDPRDAAISMTHHLTNLDGEALRQITAQLDGDYDPSEDLPEEMEPDFFLRPWVTPGAEHMWPFESFATVYSTYWAQREQPNVELFHFSDYLRDLPGEVRRLAALLQIDIDDSAAEQIADAGTLASMRSRAAAVAPDAQLGAWKDPSRFFRSGDEGEWRRYLSDEEVDRYDEMVSEHVSADLATWINGGWGAVSAVS